MIQGRRLRSELRRARHDANLTQREVAEALDWSASKLIRIERGAVGVSITDLRALLAQYDITDPQRVTALVEMARASKRPAWWSKYRHILNKQYVTLLGYEASAAVIRDYHGGVIPGLLQTEDYARAVIAAYSWDQTTLEDAVAARIERQELLDRDDPPELFYVLDEAVIRRWVGSRTVMQAQLEWLEELANRPHINIQIIPFSAGAHAGMRAPFTVYEFPPDDDEDYVVFLGNIDGSTLVRNDAGEATPYLDRFMELEKQATPKEKFSEVVDGIIANLRAHGGMEPATEPVSHGPAGVRGLVTNKRQKETGA